MRGERENWYDVTDPRVILDLPVIDLSNASYLPDRKAIKAAFRSFGRIQNLNDGRLVIFPSASVGKMWFNSGVDIRGVASGFATLFSNARRAWSEPNAKIPFGDLRRRHEAIHQYVAKFRNVCGSFFIRFTVKENTGGKQVRSEVHAAVVSGIAIYKTEGAELSTPVKTQAEDSAPFVDDKIALFLSGVNRRLRIALLVPVYNAERYLRECLDSALAAGKEAERAGHVFEVVCCDDGSQDTSKAILREYAIRHENVRVVSQPNAGVSATRNRLMDGLPDDVDAFVFLDSDDTVRPGMYAALAEAMVRTGADIAETEWDGDERVLDDMSLYLQKRTAPGRWINVINKLYRKSAVGSIRFRAGLCFEEDLFFNFEVHQAIRRKVLVPGHFYYYRTNPESATNTLDQRKYFESTTRRIRLSCEEFLMKGRIPAALEPEFRRELAKDAYRMCLRKNLKKNRDPKLRRELFFAAGDFFRGLERDCGFRPDGLNPIQRLLYGCCRSGRYRTARCVAGLT